jgi:inosine-uridine nucleoside N-ribohydrolase
LRQTIRSHPGEITLLAIGPMTNIATLFALDPEIPRLLRRLVLMIGRFGSPAASTRPPEWNAWCDPQAAAAVFRAQPALFQSVGLDVTLQVQMETEEVRRRFARGPLIPVLDFAGVWFRERPAITFHDPLAAATLFDETLCAFEAGSVEVQVQDGPQAGVTLWRPGPGRHEVAVRVNPHRFFTHFFEVCDAAAAQ